MTLQAILLYGKGLSLGTRLQNLTEPEVERGGWGRGKHYLKKKKKKKKIKKKKKKNNILKKKKIKKNKKKI